MLGAVKTHVALEALAAASVSRMRPEMWPMGSDQQARMSPHVRRDRAFEVRSLVVEEESAGHGLRPQRFDAGAPCVVIFDRGLFEPRAQRTLATQASSAALFSAPTRRSTIWPPLNSRSVGIEVTPNWPGVPGFWSTSILTTRSLPMLASAT